MNRVNAWIAVLFASALIAGFFMTKIDEQAFIGIAGLCIGYFFQKNDTPLLPK
jgi:hypothetical protein